MEEGALVRPNLEISGRRGRGITSRGAFMCQVPESTSMNARAGDLLDVVLGVSAQERSAVAAALIDSLDGTQGRSVPDAWRQKLLRRREALRTGATKTLAWAQARARLTAL